MKRYKVAMYSHDDEPVGKLIDVNLKLPIGTLFYFCLDHDKKGFEFEGYITDYQYSCSDNTPFNDDENVLIMNAKSRENYDHIMKIERASNPTKQ